MKKITTECVSWRWNGNLGDDMIWAAQESMFGNILNLGQYHADPQALLIGGGTFVPKSPQHPELVKLSRKLPTAFFGTGIGDPLFWGTDHIKDWLEIFGNARFIGVRGPLSQALLETWGLPSNQIKWIGDPALYFATEEGQGDLHPFKGKLAVNLGITYGKLYGFNEEELEKTLILILKELGRIGWSITLVSAWQPDDIVAERIKAQVPVCAIEPWHEDYARALESIAGFDIVLCEKLHVGVVAACRGVPFVALNYRSKVLDFCRSINWDKFCLSTEHLDPDQVLESIATIAHRPHDYSARLRQDVLGVRERLLESVPCVVAALE
jgi:polysaccharide pyruvyl transferase WcaK-like protein